MDSEMDNSPRKSTVLAAASPEGGFIALISLLTVLSITLAIGLSVALLGIEESRMGFDQSQSFSAFYNADGCMEEAFMRIKRNADYAGGSLSINGNSCTIEVAADGSQRVITAYSTVDDFIRKTRATVTLTITPKIIKLTLNSWQEATD